MFGAVPRDIAVAIVASLFAVAATWILAHVYYRRQSREARQLVEEAKRSGLSVADLYASLKNRTMNAQGDYLLCPRCGSDQVEHFWEDNVDVEAGDFGEAVYTNTPSPAVRCHKCGWLRSIHTQGELGI